MSKKIGVYLTDEAYEVYSRIPSKIRGSFLSALIVYAHKNGIVKEVLTDLLGLDTQIDTSCPDKKDESDEDFSDISISL